ncbi:helix-turn-helix transcriptional regulator [Streptomyces sp. NPDC046977]|uniref:helix-turn-helix domain-containing protein n=1 Tax=Streptomyces sp. NPDC046977 TaxID=3154703 RepID=UPI0033C67684
MSDDKRRPRPAVQYGPTAEAVARNVRRLRENRELTIYALSGALTEAGRPITPSAVAKIERQQRQVTVDDLVALAVIFGVSPSALLLPLKDGHVETIELTGAGAVSAATAWDWVDGRAPLTEPEGNDLMPLLEFDLYSRPPGRRSHWAGLQDLMPEGAKSLRVIQKLAQGGDDDGPSVD